MEKKDKLLPIGQFAALHGVNKKTLMWYDEVGLFRPAAVNSQNGYRYYSYQQSQTLETILLLREMGVSAKEIKAFMQERSAASMEKLLGEKIEELDREISHKKAVRETLAKHRRNMQTLLSMDLEEISIVEKKGRRLVTVELSADTSFEKAVEMITDETKKYQLSYLHDASYGSMIAVESLYAGNFEDYPSLFIEIPFPIRRSGLHVQPAGTYLRAFYRGPWEDMDIRYREILSYAEKQGMTFYGFSYEVVLNENVVEREEDAIVQIEIPVRLGQIRP
ncbi:MAG: MerR family transcriptional regulator [Anaerotignum sp.]|jgi:DNA-binding transcriptional MerR regulator|nr:MerR family transcriptional regulator [Anaerotignum sp.]